MDLLETLVEIVSEREDAKGLALATIKGICQDAIKANAIADEKFLKERIRSAQRRMTQVTGKTSHPIQGSAKPQSKPSPGKQDAAPKKTSHQGPARRNKEPTWDKPWQDIFPNVRPSDLTGIVRRRQWTLHLCEKSFLDTKKAFSQFLRDFTRAMEEIGQAHCEANCGPQLYEFVLKTRKTPRHINQTQAKQKRAEAPAQT